MLQTSVYISLQTKWQSIQADKISALFEAMKQFKVLEWENSCGSGLDLNDCLWSSTQMIFTSLVWKLINKHELKYNFLPKYVIYIY